MLVLPRMFPCQHDICLNCLAEFARSKVVSVDEQGFLALTEEAQGFLSIFVLFSAISK